MKELELDGKKITIKTTIGEVTIVEFESLMLIFKKEIDQLEKNVEILNCLSNLTIDEIESLDIDIFSDIINLIEIKDIADQDGPIKFINEFNIDGVIYKTRSKGDEFKYTIKEMILLKDIIKNKPDNYVSKLSGIIFFNVDEQGSIIPDLSIESIDKRSNIISEKLTMDIISPYIIALSNHLIKNGKSN